MPPNHSRTPPPIAGVGGLRSAVEQQLDAMSPRDRKLLAGLVAGVAIVVLAVLLMTIRGTLDDKASRVRAAKDNLELVQGMAAEYQIAAQKIERAEARLEQYKNQPLSAYIEKVARDMGMAEQLSAVTPQESEVVGGLRQTHYRVDLKKLSHQQSVEFVHYLESSGYPLAVDLARFKSVTAGGERMIDLTLELVAFQKEDA